MPILNTYLSIVEMLNIGCQYAFIVALACGCHNSKMQPEDFKCKIRIKITFNVISIHMAFGLPKL